MPSVGDFLFQGSVPLSAPTGSSTSQQFPLWLQQSIFNSINAATNAASQPYTPFPGPQVAAPSDNTQHAWDLAGQNVGNYQPFMDQAGALTAAGGAPVSSGDISTFLNPYEKYVTGALNRNLMDNILPSVQDKFVSAGQSRSPQEAQITSNSIRGTQEAVGEAMAQNYQGALGALQADRSRQLGAGSQFGQLGALRAQLGAGDIASLGTAGGQQDAYSQANINAALNNFNNQQQYPQQQISWLSNIIRGLPSAGQTQQTVGQTYPGAYGPSPYATVLGAYQQNQSGLRRGGAVRRGALRRSAEEDLAASVKAPKVRGGALAMAA